MQVQSTIYKGIEFVSFHELPADQQLLLQHNRHVERIKILIDGKVNGNCIQYKDYCAWFSSVFVQSIKVIPQTEKSVVFPQVVIDRA